MECDQCDMTVPNFECLVQHKINVHGLDRRQLASIGKCEICIIMNPKNKMKLKRYKNQEELDEHMSTHKDWTLEHHETDEFKVTFMTTKK